MSVAESFNTLDFIFPFCVPRNTEEEIAAICVDFFGTDEVAQRLTGDLAFVTSLYWNLETITVHLAGFSYYEDYGIDTTLSAFNFKAYEDPYFPDGAPFSTPPIERICPDVVGMHFEKFVIEDLPADHSYGLFITFPINGFFYNTTTEEYNIVFDFAARVGATFGSTSIYNPDGETTISLFGQTFTLWLNLGGGAGGSFLTVTDITPAYFTYV